jgi:hypothetical protein
MSSLSQGPLGIAFWPGIQTVISASYTLSHGVHPGTASITLAPQNPNQISESGTLVFSCGNNSVAFADCRAKDGRIRLAQEGPNFTLAIEDRRWRWQFGEITGHYNKRLADGSIDPATQQTAQQLFQLLLGAMGEGGYDIGDVSNDDQPEVIWSYATPARELDKLCDELGYTVVLQVSGTVAIRQKGFGNDLPGNNLLAPTFTIDPKAFPDTVKVVGASNIYQVRLSIGDPVGVEQDGTVKAVNSLSYAPANGWASVKDVDNMSDIADPAQRALAQRSVFRWFRISTPTTVPGYGSVQRLDQLLPILDTLVEVDFSTKIPKQPYVVGIFYQNVGALPTFDKNPKLTRYPGDFTIDTTKGIVQFAKPVYMIGDSAFSFPKQLQVCCSVNVQDPDLRIAAKYTYQVPVPGAASGTGPEILDHEDIVQTSITQYDEVTGNLVSTTNNKTDCDNFAQLYAQAKINSYIEVDAEDGEYAGIRADIELDGAIQQITWSVGPTGPTTKASANSEHAYLVPKVAELKRRMQLLDHKKAEKHHQKHVRQQQRLNKVPSP